MLIQILLIIAITLQAIATVYALKLVRATKYNSIWILFIIGFSLLSVERTIQLLAASGVAVPDYLTVEMGLVISVCLSIGVMYAHKLFVYIDRLNYQRQLHNRRELTTTLRAEEKVRSLFSKELHDGLGPLLSSAKMSLSALQHGEADPKRKELLINTSGVIEEAIRTVREISNNLSPHILQDFGLRRAIQNFIDRCSTIHHEEIRFTTNLREERYEKDVEVILYRVICELINNSLKHAACNCITLHLEATPTHLNLRYTDNGRGFNVESRLDSGMGLSNIHSRVSSLGGVCEIVSSEEGGMCAEIRINLQSEPMPQHLRPRRRKNHKR